MQALISVSDKTGVVELARELAALGVRAAFHRRHREADSPTAGLAVTEVAEHTGFPEMLDGRVKTLHPTIHGGLLARRDSAEHMAAIDRHGISTIDLLVVNLYPFEATVAKPGCTLAEAIENIDIGGPAMVRSAAKNWNDVAVLTDSSQYAGVVAELKRDGKVGEATRFALAVAAFDRIAQYDGAISDYLSSLAGPSARRSRAARVPGAGERPLRQAAGPALRREPAPARRLLPRPRSRARIARHGEAAAGQGALVQQHRRRRRGAGNA